MKQTEPLRLFFFSAAVNQPFTNALHSKCVYHRRLGSTPSDLIPQILEEDNTEMCHTKVVFIL